MIFQKALDRWDFIEFLKKLRREYEGDHFWVFCDNLRVHHTLEVKAWAEENGIGLIFNVAYCSWASPIEYVFS
jgi:transposase